MERRISLDNRSRRGLRITAARAFAVLTIVLLYCWTSAFLFASENVASGEGGDVVETMNSPKDESAASVDAAEGKTPIIKPSETDDASALRKKGTVSYSLVSGLVSLVVVLCVFVGLVFLTKLISPKRARKLSNSLEIVDTCWIDSKSELTTVRWGKKLILVVRASGNWVPLSELSDEREVRSFLDEYSKPEEASSETFLNRFFTLSNKDNSRVENESQKH